MIIPFAWRAGASPVWATNMRHAVSSIAVSMRSVNLLHCVILVHAFVLLRFHNGSYVCAALLRKLLLPFW